MSTSLWSAYVRHFLKHLEFRFPFVKIKKKKNETGRLVCLPRPGVAARTDHLVSRCTLFLGPRCSEIRETPLCGNALFNFRIKKPNPARSVSLPKRIGTGRTPGRSNVVKNTFFFFLVHCHSFRRRSRVDFLFGRSRLFPFELCNTIFILFKQIVSIERGE